MKVLITGASGFLGSILVSTLKEKKYRVVTLGRQEGNDIQTNLCEMDLKVDFSADLDVVIHAAGKAHVIPKNSKDAEEFRLVNFIGTQNLCKMLEVNQSKIKSFIFISTVAVYGLDEGLLIDENAPLKGETPYAKSKIDAENWLAAWALRNNVQLSILRLPLIAGFNPPGNLGAMISAIKSGRYLSIGKADARKSIVWAEDICSVIPTLVGVGGVYNLTDGYHPSLNELAQAISFNLQKPVPYTIPIFAAKLLANFGDLLGSRFPIDTAKLRKLTSTLTFDNRKAVDVLKWKPSAVLTKIDQIL